MKFIDTNPVAASLNYLKGQALTRLKLRGHYSGSTARALRSEEFIKYARQVVDDYVNYGANGSIERIRGASIMEIGPGDTLVVALLLLANGAQSVTCVEGFSPKVDAAQNKRVYSLLWDTLTPGQRAELSEVVDLEPGGNLKLKSSRLTLHLNTPVERLDKVIGRDRYDIVLSRAVLEHVSNPALAWDRMVSSLKPVGEMWHKIDFRSHNFYNAIHPLYFLTIPELLWRAVSSPDPTLNRKRLSFYRSLCERTFTSYRIYVANILENPELFPHVLLASAEAVITESDTNRLDEIRLRLPDDMRDLPPVELLAGGAFFACGGPRTPGADSE